MFPPTHDRKQVWDQTVKLCEGMSIVQSQVFSHFSKEEYSRIFTPAQQPTALIEFVKKDCVYAAAIAKANGYNPLLLNMASWVRPGGGVHGGAGAQEEDLFRRSNYHKFLHQEYYPMKRFQAILSKDVSFFRNGRDVGYTCMKAPFTLDCIASPCLKNPQVSRDGSRFANSYDCIYMKDKIRQLFLIAHENGNDCVVLSAWGCGAFHCPPEHMGELFGEVVKEVSSIFKKIVFAIIDDNYEPFVKGFKQATNGDV